MFPGASVLQICCNEVRVCTTVRQAKQRVYNRFALTQGRRSAGPRINMSTCISKFPEGRHHAVRIMVAKLESLVLVLPLVWYNAYMYTYERGLSLISLGEG